MFVLRCVGEEVGVGVANSAPFFSGGEWRGEVGGLLVSKQKQTGARCWWVSVLGECVCRDGGEGGGRGGGCLFFVLYYVAHAARRGSAATSTMHARSLIRA